MTSLAERLARFRHDGSTKKRFRLSRFDPAATPLAGDSKAADKARVEELALELDALQDLFYADRRFRMLVMLQGTDTSGKDGTIRGVFGRMSALGVRTVAWKAPNEEERGHDFLWRIHQQTPADGTIVVFNRSHYEDVLVPLVDGTLARAEAKRRYAQINDFERLLAENRTVVVKFLLHISKDEQRRRLQARIDDPTKHWKFAAGDLAVRRQWDAYQRAYEDALAATGTPWAPWIVVPADSKTHRNLMIATAMKAEFESLKLRYPPPDPQLEGLKVV
jgi:PPK2 family polyphosphate:nucleotide phosphotransferase